MYYNATAQLEMAQLDSSTNEVDHGTSTNTFNAS